MGCGANLKVTAITNPSDKREHAEIQEHRRHHNRFKLPQEVLNGFENLLKVVTRKTTGKRRKPNHLTDVPEPAGPSVVSDGPSLKDLQQEERTIHKQISMLGIKPDTPSKHIEPHSAKPDNSWVLDDKKSMVKEMSGNRVQDSLFQLVSEKGDEKSIPGKDTDFEESKVGNGGSRVRPQDLDESELLSPEAPGMLSEDEESSYDNESRRAARIELEKSAQIEATRMAAGKRYEDDRLLSEKKGEMDKMEGQASAILSKYS